VVKHRLALISACPAPAVCCCSWWCPYHSPPALSIVGLGVGDGQSMHLYCD